jgi:Uma2 family endonuclease
MNANLPASVDKAAFIAWVQTREQKRFELVDGMIVEAEPHTLGHARTIGNIAASLEAKLDRKLWHTLLSFGVDTGPSTIHDPDVMVDSGGHTKDVLANAPILLAEVLSPSSATIDLGDKPSEYMRLPSLLAYLVLSQDERKAWVWVRNESGFPAGAEVIAGGDGVIRIPVLAIELPLAEIYRDFPTSDEQV